MGNIEKKERKIHYVRTNSKDEREKLVETLENDGYKPEKMFTREEIMESGLPISVNLVDKTYGRMGNVTCASAAATQRVLETIFEFYNLHNK